MAIKSIFEIIKAYCLRKELLDMPAMISHYLFMQRVMTACKKRNLSIPHPAMMAIGAQGPDIFFFHRVLPWQPGKSYAKIGSLIHKTSPAKTLESFRETLLRSPLQTDEMLSYIDGFLCHYALDRTAHPFVYFWQEKLKEKDPHYGTSAHQYHFRIESALDTLMLRRETGRVVTDFKLQSVLPPESAYSPAVISVLYAPLFTRTLRLANVDESLLELAPADMRHAMMWMTDKRQIRFSLLHLGEKMFQQGHILTSLLRKPDTDDFDYANSLHEPWHNPFDDSFVSRDSFFELFDIAAAEAADMIAAFHDSLKVRQPMAHITQDRGFSTDLPGKYT